MWESELTREGPDVRGGEKLWKSVCWAVWEDTRATSLSYGRTAEHRVAPSALAHITMVRRRIKSRARALVNLSAELPDPVARETRLERAGMVSVAGA